MAMYDVMIVGAGPAGLSAAVNCRVRNKSTVVVSRKFESPSLSKAPLIENYLGVDAMSGRELYQRLLEHARRSGAEFLEANVTGIYDMGDSYAALTSAGDVSAVAVILATGTVQSASIPGESDKVGMGVSYCATCDGPLYKGKRVVVVGFSPHAVEEANFLSEICSEVTYVPASRGGSDVSHLKPAVNLAKGSVKAILGDMAVSGVELDSGIVETDGVFVIRESVPAERLVEGITVKDGAIEVDRDMFTGVPRVFAAGDCTGRPWQVARAVGQGQVAALSAARAVDKFKASRQADQ